MIDWSCSATVIAALYHHFPQLAAGTVQPPPAPE